MQKETFSLISEYDGLSLSLELFLPEGAPKGILQISHGMSEHKERYEDFMAFLAEKGYAAVIHDHRGHGSSVRSCWDLGYFYTANPAALVEDLHQVSRFIKGRFPGLPLFLFGHSMGSLVARVYLRRYDAEINKLILCGPPTQNSAVGLGLLLVKLSTALHGARYRNHLLNELALGAANRKFHEQNAWISSCPDTVRQFQRDPLCGFIFTNSGFAGLFGLMKEAYMPRGWALKNPDLPILLLAGAEDPVIQSKRKFAHLKSFLRSLGYRSVRSRLYEGMRHELLNEKNRKQVYQDLLRFLKEPPPLRKG